MKSIALNAPIEDLWELLSENTVDPNRIVCVFDSKGLCGIITDSEIRKYVANNRSLPTEIDRIMRKNFIYVNRGSNRLEMAKSVADQLEKRKYSNLNPINEVLIVSSDTVTLSPLSDFQSELNLLKDKFIVIGLGYVGLTLFAVLFSKIGREKVFGIESDELKLQKLRLKDFYILEPGLRDYLIELNNSNVFKGIEEALLGGGEDNSLGRRVYFVSVQTPVNEDGSTSLEAFLSVSMDIAKNLQRGDIVIVRSTVPIGTSRWIARKIENVSKLKCGIDFFLGFAPERTVEGDAIREIETLPQIISGFSIQCVDKVREVVQRWTVSITVATSLEVAEMTKLSNNAYRDHHFAFANELSIIANKHDVDINEVIHLANAGYKRSNIPLPSPGVGGPCLSKDSKILLSEKISEETHNRVSLDSSNLGISTILSARRVNEGIPHYFASLISHNTTMNSVGVILGMAFKGLPPTNDLRNSPSIDLLNELIEINYEMYCWDSEVNEQELHEFGLKSFQELFGDNTLLPSFCVIGNNHGNNVEEAKKLVEIYSTISQIFDPWDLIRSHGEIAFFRSKNVKIRNLSTLV
jgi:UDP-N-acetyl-D-mannosaminuronic acid dehydrogenase